MGHPTEFMSMADIRSKFGPNGVTAFALHWDRDGKHSSVQIVGVDVGTVRGTLARLPRRS